MNVFKKLFSVVLYWGLRIFVKESEARELVGYVKIEEKIDNTELKKPNGIEKKDWEKAKTAAQHGLNFIRIQNATRKKIEEARKNTLFVLPHYRSEDFFKPILSTGIAALFIIIIPLSLFFSPFILFGIENTSLVSMLLLPTLYLLILFFSAAKGLKEGQTVTITRLGVPCRDHGRYAGTYICFFWEKPEICFGDYIEIEYKLKGLCSDGVERDMNLQLSLRIKKPWAVRRMIDPQILRLSENSISVANRKIVKENLQSQLATDIHSVLMEIMQFIAYEDDLATDRPGGKPIPRSRYSQLVQIAFMAAVEKGLFGEAIDLKRLELVIYPAKEELSAGVRRKTASDKRVESKEIWNGFLEDAKEAYGIKANAPLPKGELADKIVKLAQGNFEAWQRGEGLRESGKGTAAGTEVDKK